MIAMTRSPSATGSFVARSDGTPRARRGQRPEGLGSVADEAVVSVVVDGLLDFFVGVHDEGAATRDGLADRLAGKKEHARAVFAPRADDGAGAEDGDLIGAGSRL